ncbi:MAG: hypothetical protein HC822_20870 [Oscillochloris sp.]|nr:hypothetical protein [Oscillochloris sp.]
MMRLEHVDLPELNPTQPDHLIAGASMALQEALIAVLAAAQARSAIQHDDFNLISGGLTGIIRACQSSPSRSPAKPARTS